MWPKRIRFHGQPATSCDCQQVLPIEGREGTKPADEADMDAQSALSPEIKAREATSRSDPANTAL